MLTLEQLLEKAIARKGPDSRRVAELRRQIAARSSAQSAEDLYVTGSVSAGLQREEISDDETEAAQAGVQGASGP